MLWASVSAAAPASDYVTPEFLKGALVINADDLKEMRTDMSNLAIIDTRDQEPLGDTISGAIHLTDRDTTPSTLIRLFPDKQIPLVFFGESARAIGSYKAARKVIGYGYVNVFWMRGGIEEWSAKGYPLGTFKQ
jgi:rhodanese-related sulfurtransferase